jgi:multidrug efflux pump subunit AcrA (membrane-fusion protein)
MNKIVYLLLIMGAVILSYFFFFKGDSSQEYIYSYPKKGDFEITVTTTGELEAINSIKVLGPTEARRVDIYEMTIARLIPEGSIVKEGDFVAELDKTPIVSKLNEVKLNVERERNEYLLAQLDSSQQLSSARDNIENLKYAMEEAKLNKQQSIYEPPSAVRQAEINYEKAERSYNNAIKSYENQLKKSIANLNVAKADLQSQMDKLEKVQTVVEKFTIKLQLMEC